MDAAVEEEEEETKWREELNPPWAEGGRGHGVTALRTTKIRGGQVSLLEELNIELQPKIETQADRLTNT